MEPYRGYGQLFAEPRRTHFDAIELEHELPSEVIDNDEIQVALAVRSLQQSSYANAMRCAKRAREVNSEWYVPILIQAKAQLQATVAEGWKTVDGPLVVTDASDKDKLSGDFDMAVAQVAMGTRDASLMHWSNGAGKSHVVWRKE